MSRFSDDVNRMVDKHEGITERPRNPHDPKPSKAAMELANVILEAARPKVTGDFKQDAEAWPSQGLDVDDMAAIVQSALDDLLEKADKVLLLTHEHISPTLAKDLRLELHRWKPK